jgi:hypothetical protein
MDNLYLATPYHNDDSNHHIHSAATAQSLLTRATLLPMDNLYLATPHQNDDSNHHIHSAATAQSFILTIPFCQSTTYTLQPHIKMMTATITFTVQPQHNPY